MDDWEKIDRKEDMKEMFYCEIYGYMPSGEYERCPDARKGICPYDEEE